MSVEKPKNLAEVLAKMKMEVGAEGSGVTPVESNGLDGSFEVAKVQFKEPAKPIFGAAEPAEHVDEQSASEDLPKPEVFSYQVEEEDTPKEQAPIPDWVQFPQNFKVPSGRTILFLRLRAEWTDTPKKGDRVVICWPITDAEEDLALERCRGKGYRVIPECTKQMIRAIDGKRVGWPGMQFVEGETVHIQGFYRDIGAKCRALLETIYTQTHRLDQGELVDFFRSCMVTRTVGLVTTMRACRLIQSFWKPCSTSLPLRIRSRSVPSLSVYTSTSKNAARTLWIGVCT